MYITETGIADAKDDRRALFIDAYFKEVGAAVRVRADCHWAAAALHSAHSEC